MDKKDLSVKRGRRRKEDPEKNTLDVFPSDGDVSFTPTTSSTPVTTKRRGRTPKRANTSLQTPEPKSRKIIHYKSIDPRTQE
jgi:hypothetical protein